MNQTNNNHNIYNIIIKSQLYKNFILRIYMINNLEYIDRTNINELNHLFINNNYSINFNNINNIEEKVLFNNRLEIFISKVKLIELIRCQNYKILYDNFLLLIQNIKKIRVYPNYKYIKKKFANDLEQLKTEINDLKNIINYLNNKVNRINENIHIDNTKEINALTESYIMKFPIMKYN